MEVHNEDLKPNETCSHIINNLTQDLSILIHIKLCTKVPFTEKSIRLYYVSLVKFHYFE